MKQFAIWYAINPTFMVSTPVTAKTLIETHRKVRVIMAESLEDVFPAMQAEVWSPNGEARGLIEELELKHTSMAVGDVAVDVMTGAIHTCDFAGWVEPGDDVDALIESTKKGA